MPIGREARSDGLVLTRVRRGVLPLDALAVSSSLRRSARDFEIRVDTAFEEVIDACGDRRRPDGWITREVRAAYLALHELGWVHSVEAWRDGRWPGACTASRSAACSPASRCSTASATPRRSR